MIAIGQMVASAGKSLLGGYELENIRGDRFTTVMRELFLPRKRKRAGGLSLVGSNRKVIRNSHGHKILVKGNSEFT